MGDGAGIRDNRLHKKTLLELYKSMLRIRLFEEKIAELYPEQQMRCPTHLCIGHEAIAAGVCLNLRVEDAVVSNHRAHGHYLAKGGDMKAMLAEIYGKETGCAKGRGGSMHLIDTKVNFLASTAIVAGTMPLAAGIAFAAKMRHEKRIAVAFFGDAAAEEGTFHETMNYAVMEKLPVLFVCENNLYASQTHISQRQAARPIYQLSASHGMLAFDEDGNDAVKAYEATKKAVNHISAGKGPVFIEFHTYRLREHCGPNTDNALGYRTENEILSWQARCPIVQLKSMLLSEGLATGAGLEMLQNELEQEIAESVTYAKQAKFPDEGELGMHIYAD